MSWSICHVFTGLRETTVVTSSSCMKRRSKGMLGSSIDEVIGAEHTLNSPGEPSPNAYGRNWHSQVSLLDAACLAAISVFSLLHSSALGSKPNTFSQCSPRSRGTHTSSASSSSIAPTSTTTRRGKCTEASRVNSLIENRGNGACGLVCCNALFNGCPVLCSATEGAVDPAAVGSDPISAMAHNGMPIISLGFSLWAYVLVHRASASSNASARK
mmetsp:Transcript_15754/g.28712  ORF Transcript_15754/g.28712 Transcript_15754/m.28712 type:complete len:214 (+) Transcript_15754:636-1277(+)